MVYKFYNVLGITYLVTLQTMHASRCQLRRVPIAFPIFNQRPHQTPREYPSQKHRYVNNVRTDHSDSNI